MWAEEPVIFSEVMPWFCRLARAYRVVVDREL